MYIGQREIGILDPSDENVDIMGSEDATTCHIVIIKVSMVGSTGCPATIWRFFEI